jgi:BlaI family transcriptional regulator, penicillinase repressor
MATLLSNRLSRRERQIMEILYKRGEMTVADVVAAMAEPPGYSAVRAFLRILEEKGQVVHTEVGSRYVYRPAQSYGAVAKSTIEQVVETFFGGSVELAVATLLSSNNRPGEDELQRLEELIQHAREDEHKRGKSK